MNLIFKGTHILNFGTLGPKIYNTNDDISNRICIYCDSPDYESDICYRVTFSVEQGINSMRGDCDLSDRWRTIY